MHLVEWVGWDRGRWEGWKLRPEAAVGRAGSWVMASTHAVWRSWRQAASLWTPAVPCADCGTPRTVFNTGVC